MRSLAELGALRATLSHALSWPMMVTLHAEAADAGGLPFVRTLFQLGWAADVPPARIGPLLDELADVGAITYMPVGDSRTLQIEVL